MNRSIVVGKPIKSNVFAQLFKRYWFNRYLILLFLPGLIYFIVFKYVPMYGLLMAFKDYSLMLGVWDSPWVGLKHFEYLVSGHDFLQVLRNTLFISFLKILFGFPAPVIFALMINEIRSSAYKRITQTVSYLPHFFSWVVLGGMITLVFSPSMGIINKLLQILGFEPIFFLASKTWFLPILIVTDIWKEVGWASIIYLAAITGVNPEMYEAAIVDGAGRFKRIFYITVPSIAPTIAVMLIMRVGTILDAGFDQVFNLYSTAVYDVADIIDTYIYRMGISSFQYSFTTAAGLFKSVIGFAMILLANYFSRRLSDGEHGVW